jgi:hypothetical protein
MTINFSQNSRRQTNCCFSRIARNESPTSFHSDTDVSAKRTYLFNVLYACKSKDRNCRAKGSVRFDIVILRHQNSFLGPSRSSRKPLLLPPLTYACIKLPQHNYLHAKHCTIYLSMALQPFAGPWPRLHFLYLLQKSVELLGRGISPLQGIYLHTEKYKQRINGHRHLRLQWESNPRYQCLIALTNTSYNNFARIPRKTPSSIVNHSC